MTENSAGTNNIDSLAERAKEMLERVRGPVDDAADVAPTPAPIETVIEEAPSSASVESEAPSEVVADVETVLDVEPDTAIEVDSEATSRLGALADQAKTSLAEVASTGESVTEVAETEIETLHDPVELSSTEDFVELDETEAAAAVEDIAAGEDIAAVEDIAVIDELPTEDVTIETEIETPAIEENSVDLSDLATTIETPEIETDTFDPADLGDMIQSDLDDLESAGPTEIIAPGASEVEAVTDLDGDLDLVDADWATGTDIDLPEVSIDAPETIEIEGVERSGFIESFENEEPVAMPIDDLVEDQAVAGLIALDDLELDEPEPVPEQDSSRPDGLGLGTAAVAGSAAAATFTSGADEASDLENLDGDIKAVAATRSYTSVAKAEPKIDNDLNDLFIESNTPDPSSSRNYTIPILIFLIIAVLALLWWLSDDSGDSENATTPDAAVTSVAPDDTAEETASTVDTAVETTTEPETTTQAPTTNPEPTIPPTVWNLVGVESGTSQFTELGAPLGLQSALEETVDADGNPLEFTLFAPSDEAISALTQDQRDALAQDVTAAETLIDYHFVDQRLTQELLLEASGGELMTRAGLPIFVDTDDGDVILNGTTRIALSAFEAENGNVLVIDSVLQQPTINTVLNLGDIQFEVISSVITDAGKTELQKAVAYFNENPDVSALIEGHTDTDGDADANLRLSDRRARAVRDFLIEQGIDGSRLVARGFGEAEPILVDGVEDKNASRRIEFTLQ